MRFLAWLDELAADLESVRCFLLGHRWWEEAHGRRRIYRCLRCSMISGDRGTAYP